MKSELDARLRGHDELFDGHASVKRSLTTIFLAAIAPGCGVDHSSAPAGGPAALSFAVVPLAPPAGGAPYSFSEPIIAVHPSGTALAVAATANAAVPPTLWLSRDSGATWTSGTDYDATGAVTGDADVAIGNDGSLYALNL